MSRFEKAPNITIYPNTILNEVNKQVEWYEIANTGDSMFRENTYFYNNPKISLRDSVTLNDLVKREKIFTDAKNIFVKIVCQGAEISILKGATDILSKVDFILLEVPFFGKYNKGVPSFLEHIAYMDSIGYIPYDITEEHYMKSFNIQLDIMFISKSHRFNRVVQDALLSERYVFRP